MKKRKQRRRTLSITAYRWILPYLVVFLVIPSLFVFLFSFVDIPDEPTNRYAEETRALRAERGLGFPAAPGTHKVIRVVTGDTLDIRAPGSGVTRVKLACVDAPRKGQRYWLEARRYLAREVDGMFVTADPAAPIPGAKGQPPNVQLLLDERDVARLLIASGFAWSQQDTPCLTAYDALQREARYSRLGLWQDLHPVPPWRWKAS